MAAGEVTALPDGYTLQECADKVRVSVKTLQRDVAAGRLVTTRIRGRVRIAPSDWEAYLKQCRSVATVRDGKSEFSTGGAGLAKLLRLDRTPFRSRGGSGSVPQIVELDARRATASKKRSSAG